MNAPAVTPFSFRSNPVRVVVRDGDPWFVAVDVAIALGYRSPKDAASVLADHQKGSGSIRTLGGDQTVTIINESGLYRLVLRSRKPEAVAFSDWVTGEVLPSIRKTGSYQKPTADLSPRLGTDGDYRMHAWAKAEHFLSTVREQLAAAGQPMPATGIDVQTLAEGFIVEALMENRWLVNARGGEISVQAVPRGAVVMSPQEFITAMTKAEDWPVDTDTLAAFAKAAITRIANRAPRGKQYDAAKDLCVQEVA